MSFGRYSYLILFAILLYVLFPTHAYAYLDPGSGSYIFQLIIAAVVGFGFLLKVYWRKVKSFVTGMFSDQSDDGSN